MLSTPVTKAVCLSTWFITLSPTVTVEVKFAELSTSLFVVVLVVVPLAASLPPETKTGELLVAFQAPWNWSPFAIPLIWDCNFPKPSKIESVAKTVAAAGVGNPVNTFPVTELLSNVTAPLTGCVPFTFKSVPVASPVTDKLLAVSQAVAVSALPCKSLCIGDGKLKVTAWFNTVDVIWFAVPKILRLCVFKFTSPTVEPSVISKSDAASKVST